MKGTLGRFGETWALGYLARLGYSIVDRNIRFRTGEIDIVARDGDDLVFVEVKCRRNSTFGSPQSAITARKYRHLETAIGEYLSQLEEEPPAYRIDVVALTVDAAGRVSQVEVLRNVEAPPA